MMNWLASFKFHKKKLIIDFFAKKKNIVRQPRIEKAFVQTRTEMKERMSKHLQK